MQMQSLYLGPRNVPVYDLAIWWHAETCSVVLQWCRKSLRLCKRFLIQMTRDIIHPFVLFFAICLQSSGPPTCGCRSAPGFPALQLSDLCWALGVGGHAGRLGMGWYSKCGCQDGWLRRFTHNYSPGLLPGLFEHVGFGIQLDSMRCVQMVAVGSCSLTSGGHGVPVVSSSTWKMFKVKVNMFDFYIILKLCVSNSTWGLNPSALGKVSGTQFFMARWCSLQILIKVSHFVRVASQLFFCRLTQE